MEEKSGYVKCPIELDQFSNFYIFYKQFTSQQENLLSKEIFEETTTFHSNSDYS